MGASSRNNDKIEQERLSNFCKALIRISMNKEDEIDTRVLLFHNIDTFEERYKKPGDYEALEEARNRFDAMSFKELKEYYDACCSGNPDEVIKAKFLMPDDEVEEMSKSKFNGPLFKIVFATKVPNKQLDLFLNGEEDHSYQKVKSFEFEGNYYVYLKAESDQIIRCYKYVLEHETDEYGEEKDIEKLIYVQDEQLIKFFDFLKL